MTKADFDRHEWPDGILRLPDGQTIAVDTLELQSFKPGDTLTLVFLPENHQADQSLNPARDILNEILNNSN